MAPDERSGGSWIRLEGAPRFGALPDRRLGLDRWDRLFMDAFIVNQVVGRVTARIAARMG